MPVLGQIWPFLGPKSNFLGAGSKDFGTLISGIQWDTFFVLKTLTGAAQIGLWRPIKISSNWILIVFPICPAIQLSTSLPPCLPALPPQRPSDSFVELEPITCDSKWHLSPHPLVTLLREAFLSPWSTVWYRVLLLLPHQETVSGTSGLLKEAQKIR